MHHDRHPNKLPATAVCLAAAILAGGAAADVTVENGRFRLVVGDDAAVRSLQLKASGEELAAGGERLPLFSVTQARPFNNEIKLIHPNKRTVYPANRLFRAENGRLVAGFKTAPYLAEIEVTASPHYVVFRLARFIVAPECYGGLKMDVPPVESFRLVQLPAFGRANTGDWLNAVWDEKAAVAVMGLESAVDIDHEERRGVVALTADLVAGRRLEGAAAALVVAAGREDFLDCVDAMERDFGLPRGVESRRSPHVNASIYHGAGEMSPANIDEHIAWAKRGGFRYMTFAHDAVVKEGGSWCLNGDYDWNAHYPNGADDLRKVLAKVKAAGIISGLHFLHTHIGLQSRYVTPVADARLGKKRRFTLASAVPAAGAVGELAVLEPTVGAPMHKGARILQFGGELFTYTGYTSQRPYRFTGVKRSAWATRAADHPAGEIGGVLDVSEFGTPKSCYIDQLTDLQDEIARKIAAIYACGFEYVYFDGAEGVNNPFNYHVSDASYRVWRLLTPAPLFAEGAAKTHFGWHMLSGANAFDCFAPAQFKAKLVEFPVRQAPIAAQEMTRVNFGWWALYPPDESKPAIGTGTQSDHWEYGEAKSLAFDCPATVFGYLPSIKKHPRAADVFEAMRRWEKVRASGRLTADEKRRLADPAAEFHAHLRRDGEIEIVRMHRVKTPVKRLSVYFFSASDGNHVLYWHETGSGSYRFGNAPGAETLEAAGWRTLDVADGLDAVRGKWSGLVDARP